MLVVRFRVSLLGYGAIYRNDDVWSFDFEVRVIASVAGFVDCFDEVHYILICGDEVAGNLRGICTGSGVLCHVGGEVILELSQMAVPQSQRFDSGRVLRACGDG